MCENIDKAKFYDCVMKWRKKTKEQVGILVIWTEQKSNWKKYVLYLAKYQLI